MSEWIVVGLVFVAGIVFGVIATKKRHLVTRQRQLDEARLLFHRMREQLEAKFLQRRPSAANRAGLRWADCEFENDVAYARDRQSGQLSAFVAVTIKFEADPRRRHGRSRSGEQRQVRHRVFPLRRKASMDSRRPPDFQSESQRSGAALQDTLEPVGLTDAG